MSESEALRSSIKAAQRSRADRLRSSLRRLNAAQPIGHLIDAFDETSRQLVPGISAEQIETLTTARHYILEELQNRYTDLFDRWLDRCDTEVECGADLITIIAEAVGHVRR